MCFRLLQALQGINSDSKLLIEILVTHSRAQRGKIKAAYDPLTRGDLVTDIKNQLGGMFCDTMVGLVLEPTRWGGVIIVSTCHDAFIGLMLAVSKILWTNMRRILVLRNHSSVFLQIELKSKLMKYDDFTRKTSMTTWMLTF